MTDAGNLGRVVGYLDIDASAAHAALVETLKHLSKLKADAPKVALALSKIGDANVTGGLSGDLAKAGAGLDKLKTSAASAGDTVRTRMAEGVRVAASHLEGFRSGLADTSDLLGKIALPAVAAGAAASRMSAQFDSALRNVNSIAKLTEQELGQLGQKFVALSLDQEKSREGARSLAEGYYDIQSAGFAGADGLKVLEASTKAASAGLTSTAVSGRAISAVLNAYGRSADEATAVSDTLFATVDQGVITFEQLSSQIGRVLPVANTAGLSLEQVGAAIATMTKSGLSGEQSITNLTSLLTSVIKPTKEASDLANELGINFSLTGLQAKGFAGFLQEITEKTGGNAEQMAVLIGSQEGLNAALSLTKNGVRDYIKELDGMQKAQGKTDAAFKETGKSATEQLKIIRNQFEAAGLAIGSVLLPKVVDVAKAVGDLTAAFAKLPDDERQRWIDIATALGGAAVAGFAITKALQGAIAVAVTGRTVFAGLAVATNTLGVTAGATAGSLALMAAPIVAITALLGGLIIANSLARKELERLVTSNFKFDQVMRKAIQVQQDFDTAVGELSPGAQTASDELDRLIKQHTELAVRMETIRNDASKTGQLRVLTEEYKAQEEQIALVAEASRQLLIAQNSPTAKADQLRVETTAFHDAGAAAFMYAANFTDTMDRIGQAARGTATVVVEATEEQKKALDDARQAIADATADAFTFYTNLVDGQVEFIASQRRGTAEYKESLKDLTDSQKRALQDLEAERDKAKPGSEARANLDQQILDLKAKQADELALVQQGHKDRQIADATAFANEQAALREHLGTQLIARVRAIQEEANLDPKIPDISDERANAFIEGFRRLYGVLPGIADENFGQMQQIVDTALKNGLPIEQVLKDLGAAEDSAVELKESYDALVGQYTVELKQELDEGEITLPEYTEALTKLPARVVTELLTEGADTSKLEVEELVHAHQQVPRETHTRVTQEGADDAALSVEELAFQQQKVKPTVDLTVTSNVPAEAQYWLDLANAQDNVAPVTDATVASNLPAEIAYWQNLGKEQGLIAPVTQANVSDNVDEVRGRYLILAAKRAAITQEKPAFIIDDNADAVTRRIEGVISAVSRIPSKKTVVIEAIVDPMLQRHSPSPLEQIMDRVDEFASRSHKLNFNVSGLDRLTGGFADDPDPLGSGKVKISADAVEAHLRKLIASLQDTSGKVKSILGQIIPADAIAFAGEQGGNLGAAAAAELVGGFDERKPMEQIATKVKTALGKTIPADAVPFAGKLGGDLGEAMGQGAVDKLKTVLNQGIPGAVEEAVSKALRSDKNRSDEPKPGKMGNLGQFVTQGTGTLGQAVAEAGDEATDIAGSDGELTALAFVDRYRQVLSDQQPQFEADLTDWFHQIRRDAIAPALTTGEAQMSLSGQAAMAAYGASLIAGLGTVETTVGQINAALAAITREVTVNIHANVDEVLQRHSPSIIEQTLMSIRDLAGSMPRVDVSTIGALALRSQSPIGLPSSSRQPIVRVSPPSTRGDTYVTMHVVLPPGTPQAHVQTLQDLMRSEGM